MKQKKILLCGVPLGTNNIGDEAIMETIVSMIRELNPQANITVSTEEQKETQAYLNVNTSPLIGFNAHTKEVLQNHDIIIWAGATGLSDYPEIPLGILRQAQRLNKQTIVFCVGMNQTLNPIKYKLLPGRKKSICNLLNALTLGKIDFVSIIESRRERKTRQNIGNILSKADLVIARDKQSEIEILKTNTSIPVFVGADPAITVTSKTFEINQSARKKIGLCLSAQGSEHGYKQLPDFLDHIIDKYSIDLYFIPMNHVTDKILMEQLQSEMKNKSHTFLLTDLKTPQEIAGVAEKMDLTISSRLHLLILTSIAHTPFIGIERGEKINNFVGLFGKKPVGKIDSINYESLENEIVSLLNNRAEFTKLSHRVRNDMLKRLDIAKEKLSHFIHSE